ncbi:putative acetyltransferase [Cellulomonas sp. Marseille-Q8402]
MTFPPSPSASPGGTDAQPWRAWRVGQRVVVRRRLPAGEPQPYTDVLGDLVAVDDAGVTVRTRGAGDVRVPGAEIALGKVVPPAPPRRERRRGA